MQTIQDVLQRMRELAVQSSSDTNTTEDRGALQAEFEALRDEIGDISSRTEFNTMVLLGSANSTITVQSGANGTQTTDVEIPDLAATALGAGGGIASDTIANATGARTAITSLDNALQSVSMARANIGAVQNRLEFKIQNLNNQAENIAAAESRIRDADMAATMTEFTKNNILFQASTAMLAQANSQPQSVLQLLG
jgi:flagellin